MKWILVFLGIQFALAQTVEPSSGIGNRTIQLELESNHMTEREGSEMMKSWSIPSVLVRYGVSDRIEFQLNVPFMREQNYMEDYMVSSRILFDKVQAGISVNLWKEKGIIPESALMARALIPVYDYQTSEIGKLVSLNFSNTITEQLILGYNIGFIATEFFETTYAILNLYWELSPVVHCFVEYIGTAEIYDMTTQCMNTGIGFNIGQNLSIDLSFAKGLNHKMTSFGGILTYQLHI